MHLFLCFVYCFYLVVTKAIGWNGLRYCEWRSSSMHECTSILPLAAMDPNDKNQKKNAATNIHAASSTPSISEALRLCSWRTPGVACPAGLTNDTVYAGSLSRNGDRIARRLDVACLTAVIVSQFSHRRDKFPIPSSFLGMLHSCNNFQFPET